MKILLEHQRRILSFAHRRRNPALFLDMRLGKTVITVRRVMSYPDCSKILVVCPYSAFSSWEEELLENHQSYLTVTGTRAERLQTLARWSTIDAKWFLVNKEGFLVIPELKEVPWDVVILDESTFIKSPSSQVTRFFTQNFRDAKHRWILSGTPNPESDLDYFSQFLFLDGGETFSTDDYWRFRFRYFRECDHQWYPSPMGHRFIASRLKESAYFMTRKEVRDIKEKTRLSRKIPLPPKVKKIYQKLETDFLIDLPDGDISSTIFATEKYIWLRALASGFLPDGSLSWDGKLIELLYLLQGELKGQKVIVWASRTHEILKIAELLSPLGGLSIVYGATPKGKRPILEMEFRKGKNRFFLANPECYKFGANLSEADAMIYFSNYPALLTRSQSEDRIINLNKNTPSLIIDLLTEGTVDEDIRLSLQEKSLRSSMTRMLIKRMEGRTHG